MEAMNPLNLRKEVEMCLPAAFQFWAIPEFRKLLDEKISPLVFGGSLLKETDDNETSDQGFICTLLLTVKLLCHMPFLCHYKQYFFKEDLVLSWKNYVRSHKNNATHF